MRRAIETATLRRLSAWIAFLGSATVCAEAQVRGARFEDVSQRAGVREQGHSFGAGAWSDFDRDGDPDLYDPHHHGANAQLFENLGNGRFADVSQTRFYDPAVDRAGDFHGAAWADFDNDGDRDLLVTTGAMSGTGATPKRFFLQDRGLFYDVAGPFHLDYENARGRTALWLPFNRLDSQGRPDPQLDAIITAQERSDGLAPTGFFLSTAPRLDFFDITSTVKLPAGSNDFMIYSDLSGDLQMDLLVPSYTDLRVFEVNSSPIRDISKAIGFPTQTFSPADATCADFDGNGLIDVFLATSEFRGELLQTGPHQLCAIEQGSAVEAGLSFAIEQRQALAIVDFFSSQFDRSTVFLGASGVHPSGNTFKLNFSNPRHYGIFPHRPGVDQGIYAGIDQQTLRRQILVSSPNFFSVNFVVNSAGTITDPQALGYDPHAPFRDDLLLMAERDSRGKLKFVDRIQDSGLDRFSRSTSCVSGDFDNDGDLDLFVLHRGQVFNDQHSLYWNDGQGQFRKAQGAAGIVADRFGRADAVSKADFDRDGFLDLYITNGQGEKPFSESGHTQLFRNLGNSNHWLEVALEGTTSNRDGIGARLTAHLGGGRVLIREANGGVHAATQDDGSVVHFGLGGVSIVRRLEIDWPSGRHQVLLQVPADQVVLVRES